MSNHAEIAPSPRQEHGQGAHSSDQTQYHNKHTPSGMDSTNGGSSASTAGSTPLVHPYNQVNQIPMMVPHYPTNSTLQQYQYQQQMLAQSQYYQQPKHHQQQQQQQQQHTQQQQQQQQQQGSPIHHVHHHQLQHPQVGQISMAPIPAPQLHHSSSQHDLSSTPGHQFQTPTRSLGPSSMPNTSTSAAAAANQQLYGNKHGAPPGTPESQRKKPRKSDHAFPGDEGDQELKSLAYKALELPLDEFAAQVRSIEASNPSGVSTPNSNSKSAQIKQDVTKERQRQVFGMTWLLRACDSSSTSVVPRNRIYARYVGVCADNGVKPLSPASFGKLVRIVFPNLTTRRLGMRGQSKYHYCGLRLIGDDSNNNLGNSPMTSSANTPLHNPSFESSFLPGTPYAASNSPASFQASQASTPLMSNATTSAATSTSVSNFAITSFLNENVTQELKFLPDLLDIINSKDADLDLTPLNLPDIKPFLPPSTDLDIADTLYGLYKAHCTSIFESMRYMQLKKLSGLLSSFHGSLTSPVLKLYSSSSIFPWVSACDSLMYRSVLKMLAKLSLQDIPNHVLQQLKQVSQTFTEKLSNSLTNIPVKLAMSKLKLSKQFCQLISRLVRVAETAQSANKVLAHTLDRNLMLDDWSKHVNVEQIASKELPCEGENHKKAVEVLANTIPELLRKETSEFDSFIVEWGNYLSTLPQQFPDIPPRLFLLCASAVLTSALREISLAGGAGFGAWWVVRCWIDEWIGWCAEMGGFLSNSFDANARLTGLTNDNNHSYISDGPKSINALEASNPQAEACKNEETKSVDEASGSATVDLLDGQFGGVLRNGDAKANSAITSVDDVAVGRKD